MRRALRVMLGCVTAVAVLAVGAAAENVIFTYAPPNPSEITTVSLRGSFNEWGETPMLPQSDGAWSVTIDLPPGEHEYKYCVNESWPQDMAASPTGGPFDEQADGYAPDNYGGRNAVRMVGLGAPGTADTRSAYPYAFKETILSAEESLIEIDPQSYKRTSVASASMRLMYDVHHLATQRGFTYVIIHDQEMEPGGKGSLRLEFLNVAPEGYEVMDLMDPGPERRLDPDKTLYDAAKYIEFWDSEGMGTRQPPRAVEETARVIGYRLEDGEVIFEFRTADYQGVTRGDDGLWLDLGGISIDAVAIAGEFNGWSTHAWPMSEAGDGIHELRKGIDQFSGRATWQFKFVINDLYWVEPPENAANRVSTDQSGGPVNLVLTIE